MTPLEDSPSFNLWHDPTCACLYATWQGRHTSSLTRRQYGLIQAHVRQTGSTKLLNDGLLDEDGWDQVTCWLADKCFTTLADEGLQAVAWVLPRHPGAFYDTARVLARLQRPIVDTFVDAQAAYDWLHRWPRATASPLEGIRLTPAAFLLLPAAQQVAFAQQHGQPLAPWWEAEYYIKPYWVLDELRVDIFYHLHSGVLYQVLATPIQPL